jgi:hypothetical protein
LEAIGGFSPYTILMEAEQLDFKEDLLGEEEILP